MNVDDEDVDDDVDDDDDNDDSNNKNSNNHKGFCNPEMGKNAFYSVESCMSR